MLSYIAIYPETLEQMEEYSDADKYALIAAMLAYATTGTEPEFSDAKKYIWKSLRQSVDRMAAKSETQRKNRQGKTEPAEPTATEKTKPNQPNQTEPTATEKTSADESNPNNENENENDSENEPEDSQEMSEEDDEEEQLRARAREEVRAAWQLSFGRQPTPAVVRRLETTAVVCGFDAGVIGEAIRIAALKMPTDPLMYVLTLLGDWHAAHVHTAAEMEAYLVLYERANRKESTAEDIQALTDFKRRKRTDTAVVAC